MKWRQLKWTKAIKLLEKSHLSLKLLQKFPCWIRVIHLSVQRSTLKYWPLWASLLSLTHSILFCFNSFQEAEKVTLSKWSTPAVSHCSYHANSKSAHIVPGNPTSSTGAKESGTITHYTIFNVFTPLTSGILPKDAVLLRRELLLQCPHLSSTQWHCSQPANWSAYTARIVLLPIIICHLIFSILAFLIWPIISRCSH